MHAAYGSIEKSKARFVGKGFSLKEGVDLDKTFAQLQEVLRSMGEIPRYCRLLLF
jgi:hypothetical protein